MYGPGTYGIGKPVIGGLPGSILFITSAGNVGQFNPGFTWDDVTNTLVVGNPGTEGGGITVNTVLYNAQEKITEIGLANIPMLLLHRHSTTLEPLTASARSNSNTNAHADVTPGMALYSHYAAGWAGNDYKLFGNWRFVVDPAGAVNNGSAPGTWILALTPNGSVNPVDVLSVDNAGNLSLLINPLAITQGGTGARTKSAAATNLAVPQILAKSAIPFIKISSGSIAANGAISGITALPTTYANAYCLFPANALAVGSAAGWYYCTFSSTIAGTAYLNTYVSGIPVIPGVLNPVVAGQGAYVGVTTEGFGPTITIPANAIGANGQLRTTMHLNVTNNANVKTARGRFSGNGGTIVVSGALANGANDIVWGNLSNRGITNSQIGHTSGIGFANGAISVGDAFAAVDTTIQTTYVFSLQGATATDNIVLESFLIELLADGT